MPRAYKEEKMARRAPRQEDQATCNHFILNSPNGDSDSFTNDYSESYSSVKARNSSSTDPPSDEKLKGSPQRGSSHKGSPHRMRQGTPSSMPAPTSLRTHQPTHPEARSGKVFASVGSVFHDEGRCQPCRFVSLPDGCRNGAECTFCHNESHETDPNSAHRPPKGVRSGYKKSVNQAL
ncbi:Pacrg [Symbiodinium natans]|uniref:Pacrg protein n=1 Tax=Symbiodinium natans TaxID=878477 RepID=A0A812KAE1_9DINO|nr:Pacrg [Symbiodinium natans]